MIPFIENLLSNSNSLPSGISTNHSACGSDPVIVLGTHSPVVLQVYDSQNRHTGPNVAGDIDIQIPGSFYETISKNSFILVPASDIKPGSYPNGINLGSNGVVPPLRSSDRRHSTFNRSILPAQLLRMHP
jgi:hypothetical protein